MGSFAIQLAGSLVSILALAWLAHWLGLGGDARSGGEGDGRALTDEAIHGFGPVEIAIDKPGMGAPMPADAPSGVRKTPMRRAS